MEKVIFLFIVMLTVGFKELHSQQPALEKVREQFFAWDKTENGAFKLYNSLANADLSGDPVLLAYRGASSAAAAESVSGVRKKLEYFNRGKSELEKAVGMKHLDAEVRFLRLATQVNAPGFLGYTGDIRNDKAVIIKTMVSVGANHPNAYLYLRICRFLIAHVQLDDPEKNTVNQLIVKFNTPK